MPFALDWRWLILGGWVASALFIHFRGKERHTLLRQFTDHSTFTAPYNALMYLFSGVKNRPVLDDADFPQVAILRDNWETIRDEALALFQDGEVKASARYDDLAFNSFFKHGWKRFYLKWYDDWLPSAKDRCPETVALLDQVPGMNAAMFTVMSPHSRLPTHRDPFAGSVRYHLGLVTPNSEQCRIYIDGDPYHWRDGEDILFDETYIHRVRNDTDEHRLILFCDIARPLRTPVIRGLNRLMTRHVVKASATSNEEGEKVGILNRLFGYAYQFRLFAKRIKAWNKFVYYTLKFLILGGLLWLVFLHRWT